MNLTSPLTSQQLTNDLLMEIPRRFPGSRVWRQNVGKAVGWQTVMQAIELIKRRAIADACKLLTSRPIMFGLRGQADITGFIVTAGPIARRLEVEVKAGRDKMSEDQKSFRAVILKAGGIHVIARDVEAALEEISTQVNR